MKKKMIVYYLLHFRKFHGIGVFVLISSCSMGYFKTRVLGKRAEISKDLKMQEIVEFVI